MFTLHHLRRSQSERILWLCEELGLDYALRVYDRDPQTRLSPPELRAIHPLWAAPVLTDGDLALGESAAIMEYILARYGDGRLAPAVQDPAYADYLYWFHFTNGTLQPVLGRNMIMRQTGLPDDHPVVAGQKARFDRALGLLERRLGTVEYVAGPFTAADIMLVFSLTTMRMFLPFDLAPFPNIRAYLQRIGERPAYRRAMAKGDPGFEPMLT